MLFAMQISWRQRGLLVSVFLSHSIIVLEEPGVSSRRGFPPQARHQGAGGKHVQRSKEMLERGKFSEEESKLTSSACPPLPGGETIPSLARRMRVNTFEGDGGPSSTMLGTCFATAWQKAGLGDNKPSAWGR